MATATTAKPNLTYFLNNPCHNCRRRRLRCDRSRPSCNKCSSLGRECLGYDKLFVWTQCAGTGTSSRGTTAASSSATTPAITPPAATPPTTDAAAAASTICIGTAGGAEVSTGPATTGSYSSRTETSYFSPAATSSAASSSPDIPNSDGILTVVPYAGYDARARHGGSPVGYPRIDGAAMICIPTTLTDPLFKNLHLGSRRYLSHFTDRVCRDLAAHDGPDCNPFRELIPLSLAHPFLLHIIIATSAMHMSNVSQPPITTRPPLLEDPADHLQCLRATDGISRRAFLDSLVAKDRAIQHLRSVLKDPKGADRGVLLAAMLFFVNFELIDIGRGGWKDHLHGACRILDLLKPEANQVKFESRTALHDCIVSDFVIYHILGSTLVSAGLAASITKHALDLFPVMERVEATSYLCCPATILQLILSASRLSGDATEAEIPHSVTVSALDIIHRAMAFDIRAWAVSIQPRTKVPDLASRTAVAMAHRAALCLYILQAVPSTRPHASVSVEALVGVILEHLAEVDEGDVHFKATSWPTFIAGAEARDDETREWVLSRLMRMWDCCPWGYVFAAVEMLKRTWRMRDEGSVGEVGWLQELWAMDMGFLIV